jgi:PilZ domain-containing protein
VHVPLTHEHRSSARLPLELVVHVRWKDETGSYGEADGRTADMSGNGLFLSLPARLTPDTFFTFTVYLPRGITNTPIELVGQGRVVRSDQNGESCGIAAIIDDYQLLPSQFDA